MRSEELKLQSAVSRVQNKISALADGLAEDCYYLLKCQNGISECVFVALGKVLSGHVMQFKNTMYIETKQTVDDYANGWQTHLKGLSNTVTTFLVAPSSLAGAASNSRSSTEARASGD